ncbi:MAG TPA: NADP-dependent oxidoreductase [Acidobacteriaceae bacterium]|nr:NADP-dependent oxidoreductase [Acidobacteriaceae bacterium]
MKTMQCNSMRSQPLLIPAQAPQPQPQAGQLLIRVHAAGVTSPELDWYPTTHTQSGQPRPNAVPGHEFSGTVAALGPNAQGFEVGQAVYGMNDWFADGATAEFCLATPGSITAKPASLSHEEAATVPISALTAWQGLLDRAKIQPGESVLIQGGAGAVGIFAVQLAHLHGACILATASAGKLDFLKQLGADQAIDYRSSRLEDEISKVDIVFDTVGGETLEHSWNLLKPGGRMVTIASDSGASTDPRIKDAFFIVEPKQDQLAAIARLIDSGKLRTFVNAVVPLDRAAEAYNGAARDRSRPGKMVVSVS